jgi:hypothetical protein
MAQRVRDFSGIVANRGHNAEAGNDHSSHKHLSGQAEAGAALF